MWRKHCGQRRAYGYGIGEDGKIRGPMKNRTDKPKLDRESFGRQVAELLAELAKLPADRQEQLRRELEDGIAEEAEA